MRKTVTRTRQETVNCCDLCERADCINLDRCFICGREHCYRCGGGMFYGKSGDLVEMAIKVCHDCQRHTKIAEKVQSVLDGANQQLREWVELWKDAVKKGVTPP